MTNASTNAYLTTRVMSASPEELRLLLLDGAIKFARQGLEGLRRRDYETSYAGVSQCRNIVLELLNGVRADVAPELGERVRAVYSYLYTELVEVGMQRDERRLAKAIDLLEYERETWAMLMAKLTSERAGGDAPPAQDGDERSPLSVQA
jgi:flagellar protein FliS